MADKADFSGMKPDELREKGRQALENEINESKQAKTKETGNETSQPEESETTQKSSTQSNESSGEDAKSELSKYDNVLKNTFGFDESEITEKDRKLAKSWSEIQSTATKAKQEASQHKQVVDRLNSTLEQYPSLYEKLQQAVQGQYKENPSTQEPNSGQPEQSGQLDYNVDEQTLIKENYLNPDDLEGLDDLAKQRKIFAAEMKYMREQEKKRYLQDVKSEQDNIRQQQELQQVKQENKRRFDEGFDEFVTKYGVNFAQLDDNVLNQIQKRVQVILDPDDPRKIAEDAFEVAASRILPQHGIELGNTVQPSGKDLSGIEDTGRSFNKASQPQKKTGSIDEQLRKRAYEKFSRQSGDPKAKFRTNTQ